MIILLTLSCSSKIFDHPALGDESSASAELAIIRSHEFFGSCCPFCLRIDGWTIVCLRVGRYATVRIRPGRYRLSTRGYELFDRHRPDFAIDMEAPEIDLEVGETAYVVFAAWGGITIVSPEEGKALMRESKRIGED
jgi:hypothetical protein